MTDEKKNNPRSQYNSTLFPEPAQIRDQAVRKARSIQQPDFSSMALEEIQQQFHELQVKQIEAGLENEQLRSGLEHTNGILTGISDGVWSLTWPDLELIYLSPATEEIYGRPLRDFNKKPALWQEVVHPEDQHLTRQAFEQLRETGAAKRQCRILRPDGSIAWVSDKSKLVFDENNNPVRVQGICRDITENKQAEDALVQNKNLLEGIINGIPDILAIQKPDHTVERYNQAGYNAIGISPEAIKNRKCYQLIGRESECALCATRDALKTKKPAELEKYVPELGQHLNCRSNPILDQDGNVVYIIEQLRDITERKQAEERLQESEQRFRTVLENLPGGIFAHDPEGWLLFINEDACRNTGYSREELLQMHVADIDPSSAERADRLFWQSLESGQSVSFESTHIRKDGSAYDVEIHLNGINLDGKPAILPITFDISDRKQAEKEQEKLQTQLVQARKMESVGQLAGGVAHDFNNKLTIINGYAEMAIDMMDPSDPLHETIREIHTAGKQSAATVRQLLAFARKQTISPLQLDLNDTIANMLKMLQRLIGENIDLAWHPGNNLWPVKIDPSQMDQIMANLTVNARDAITEGGQLTIETDNVVVDQEYCRTYPHFVPGKYVMLTVSDDGCGMDRETQDNIFEPFFTTKGVGEGSGLGLPTVYGIVKQNKGFIHVYSEPGEGTTFTIYLPRHEEQESSASDHRKESTEQMPTGAETILLVEDETAILEMGRQMLERLGYTVLPAENPDDALQIAEEHGDTIRLLITDVVMPVMNGPDLAAKLSVSNPYLKTIYMSGYTENAIARHGVLDEGVQFIQKPFSMTDLAVKIREALEQG